MVVSYESYHQWMHLENLALLSILLYSAHYATTLFIHRSHRRWPRIHKPGDYVAEEIDTGKKQILRGIITAYKTHKENKVFVLRCPSPTSEHWINKVNGRWTMAVTANSTLPRPPLTIKSSKAKMTHFACLDSVYRGMEEEQRFSRNSGETSTWRAIVRRY